MPALPSIRVSVRAIVLLAACALAGIAPADVKTTTDDKKKKKDPEMQIPEVRDAAAVFVAGQAVNIELTASIGSLRPVDFLIRQQPVNGTLSAVRPHPRATNKAIVTYTHRGGDAPLADRFTFAARLDGGPVSAPAVLTLTGQRFEPKLELVDYVAVDKVFLGGEATIRFAVRNAGAAEFASDIAWEAPWQGPPRIELKPGETGRYFVQFRPEAPGVYRLEKLLQPGVAGSKLPLYGQCVRPLTVSPGKLVLVLGSSGAREGELLLANGRPEPMRVQVRPGERLQGGGSIEVPGGGRAKVALALPPQDVAAFRGEVQVISTQGGETVAVEAAAKPPELRVESPAGGVVDLGSVPVGKSAAAEVVIVNRGGSSALIQAQARAPLEVQPSGEAVRLEPGSRRAFKLSMTGDQPGPLATELSFSGETSAPRLTVQMQVLAMSGAPAPAVARAPAGAPVGGPATPVPVVRPAETASPGEPQNLSPVQRLLMDHLATFGLPVPSDRINTFLERVTSLELLNRTSHSLTIAWKKPSVVPATWIIETARMAQVGGSGGSFVKIWTPLKSWKIVDGGEGRVAAQLDDLPPASQIELRIMGADRDQKVSEPSPGFLINTAEPWSLPGWIWQAGVAGLLALAAYVLNRMRRGDWEWPFRREPKPSEGLTP